MMSKHLKKPRVVSAIVGMLLLLVLLVWLAAPGRGPAAAMANEAYVLTRSEAETVLYRLGLDPESLAACGVDSGGASIVVANLTAHLRENPGAIRDADAAYDEARVAHDQLRERVVAGTAASDGDVAALRTAEQTLASASTARDAAMNAARTAATTDLPEMQRTVLATVHAAEQHGSRVSRAIPVEFMVAERTESQWLAIRNALANERISAKRGELADTASQELLGRVRSEAAVASASAGMAQRRGSVRLAFDRALGDIDG